MNIQLQQRSREFKRRVLNKAILRMYLDYFHLLFPLNAISDYNDVSQVSSHRFGLKEEIRRVFDRQLKPVFSDFIWKDIKLASFAFP